MKTEAELRQIAMDLGDGKIFTDRHLRHPEELPLVFMVIPLGAFKNFTEEQRKNIGLVYEYYDQAGPGSANGYPLFMSLRMLTREETEQMIGYYKEYMELKNKFSQPREEK